MHKARQKHDQPYRPHFLFVDDEQQILNLFQIFFSTQAEVSVAIDGKEALEQISQKHFDCIISDVNMPVLDGLDLFKNLFAKDSAISKRFLFCTGHPSSEFESFCTTYDVKYINKPISLQDMQKELQRFCSACDKI